MISSSTKKSITAIVPVTLTGIAGYVAYRQKARWEVIVVVFIAAYILSMVLSKSAMDLIGNITDRPPIVDLPRSQGGALPSNFEADRWATALKDDVYTIFAWRDEDLYRQLAAMNDSQLAAVGNAFNRLYFAEHQESIVQAMKAENYGNGWVNDVADNAKNIINRLVSIGFI